MASTVVIAPDSFKGGPGAPQVSAALAHGWRQVRPDDTILQRPMADGGEGTLDTLESAVPGAVRVRVPGVTGPDGRRRTGCYLQLPDGRAVVELAAVSGLPLMPGLDPLGATSRGVGETIGAALDGGATGIVLAVGGSASTDGGVGALAALGARPTGDDGRLLPDGGGALVGLAAVDLSGLRPAPADGIQILSDVDNPLLGPDGAAPTYGPQKGADAAQVLQLQAGLQSLSRHLGGDPFGTGTGAAGGVAYGFCAAWDARIRPGSTSVAELIGLPGAMRGASLVITGEGRFDRTSLHGKVVAEILRLAADAGTPVAVVAGSVDPDVTSGAVHTIDLTRLAGSTVASMSSPLHHLSLAARRLAGEDPMASELAAVT